MKPAIQQAIQTNLQSALQAGFILDGCSLALREANLLIDEIRGKLLTFTSRPVHNVRQRTFRLFAKPKGDTFLTLAEVTLVGISVRASY